MTRVNSGERDWILAGLGPQNLLPRFRFQEEVRAPWGFDGLDETDRAALQGDFRPRVLPHALLDGYDRARRPGRVATVQLENEQSPRFPKR